MLPRCETLGNGLRVVMVPCEAESVAVGLFIASGSRHETAKTAGISHFIEHMLFKGTPTRSPLDLTRAIEGRGGNFNACTGEESTAYFCHLPSEYLGEAVELLSDMYLHASIPEEEFEREKQVVLEEIKMYADEPDAVAMENLQRNLFPESRLGAPVAGSAKSLVPLTSDDLRRYIRTHYRPDNTIAVIVGAFDPASALKALAPMAAFRRARSRPFVNDLARRPRVIPSQLVTKQIQQAQLALGYRTFGIDDPRKYAASVLDGALGRGMMSRLFQEVREKRGLSYDISSRMQFFDGAGMFTITAGLDVSKRELAIKTIDAELRKIATRRLSATELNRIKEFLIGNFRLSHEKITSKMFFYGSTYLTFNRLVSTTEQVEGIRRVSATELQQAAAAIFRPANRSISWVLPDA